MKDPWFKLFGKTIPMKEEDKKDDEGLKNRIYEDAAPADAAVVSDLSPGSDDSKSSVVKADPNAEGEDPLPENSEASQNCANGDNCNQEEGKTSNQEPPNKENGITVPNPNTKQENVETETNAAENQDKAPKKPDKLLPCPRCDSMDTKFCYYNNYNVNQPRHFCKNCQRYWTAGGTMRNVPVGAGRRKNKNSTSHYRHMMMSDSMAGPRADATDAAHHQVLPAAIASSARVLNGSNIQLLPLEVEAAAGAKVLNFGPDAPLCESMATALSLADHTVSGRKILRVKDEDKGSVTVENRDDQSCGSSSISNDKEGTASEQAGSGPGPGAGAGMPGIGWLGANGISSQAQQQQFYGACPWLYGWNFGWGACPSTAPAQMYLNGMAHAAAAAASAGIPWPFIPAATYWPAPAGWVGAAAGAWNMPPFSPAATTTSTSNSSSGGSGSPTLGKHSRDNPLSEDKPDGCLWVPKTLRIDDPGEAAKSSIWTTLGISAKSESITGGGIFKAFQSKTEDTDAMKTASQGLLAANPAALQRSMAFQEST